MRFDLDDLLDISHLAALSVDAKSKATVFAGVTGLKSRSRFQGAGPSKTTIAIFRGDFYVVQPAARVIIRRTTFGGSAGRECFRVCIDPCNGMPASL